MLFAGINNDGIVNQLVGIPPEFESNPLSYIYDELNLSGTWINATVGEGGQARCCGVGYVYMSEFDRFVPPKPFPSWVLDDNFLWVPPVAHPGDGLYTWNEGEQRWDSVQLGLVRGS
jgi:hypothetical protein